MALILVRVRMGLNTLFAARLDRFSDVDAKTHLLSSVLAPEMVIQRRFGVGDKDGACTPFIR